MTAIPIKGAVLKWAREYRGLDLRAAADQLGISVEDLIAYEGEERAPTLTAFENFAAQYRLPQATLFLATPPTTPADPQDYRTLSGLDPKKSFDFRIALSNVRTLLFYSERAALEDEEFVRPAIRQIGFDADPDEEGEKERRRFAVSVEDQLSWRSTHAFRNWRRALEAKGVLVFGQKFPMSDCRGFSLFETPNSPCVVFNKTEHVEVARAFTLWHEYAHLMLRRPGICDENPRSPIEAFCNRFAAAFLMPREAVRAVLPVWPNEPVDWPDANIKRGAQRLKVSQRAFALRLEEVGLAPAGFNKRFSWPVRKPRVGGGGGNYLATRLSEIGGAFVRRVFDALDRGAIDSVEAVEALALSEEHFDAARAYLEPAPTGETGV